MDVKGITWVGDVYEKFEAMCLEVEEIMYQDTVKYVENQVQTVGESVKKFYSDVMQDLLPPSSLDPEKTLLHGLDLGKKSDDENNNKPNVSKKGAGNVDLELSSGDILCNKDTFFRSSRGDSLKVECSDISSIQYCYTSLSNHSNLGVRENLNKDSLPSSAKSHKVIPIKQDSSRALCDFFNEASCDQAVTTTTLSTREDTTCDSVAGSCNGIESRSECRAFMSNDHLPSNMIGSVKSVENEANEMRVSTSGGWSAEINEDNLSNEVTCIKESSHNEEEQQKHDVEEIFVSHPEGSSESSSDAACANVVAINGLKTNEQTDSAKLEDTCVMVNEDELQFLPNREIKRRTYKKKIQGAFTSKRKLARKQEYEQLAAWFGDEAKLEQQCGKSLTPTTSKDLQKLPNDDSCESEWELL